MKNTFLLLISILSFQFSFSQCDEYYINELISGNDEKCFFEEGTKVRFCPNLRGMAIGQLTMDISQWSGVSSQYITVTKNGGIAGTLVLKLKEKELLVNLNGCGGARKYSISLSEDEYNKYEQNRKLVNDKNKIELEAFLEQGNIEEALELMSQTNFSQSDKTNFLNKINTYIIDHPIKSDIDFKDVDSLIKIKGKNKYDLPFGDLILYSMNGKGLFISNKLGEEVLKISDIPFQINLHGINLPSYFEFNFKVLDKSNITANDLINNYLLAVSNSISMKECRKKIKKVKSYEEKFKLTIDQIPFYLTATKIWMTPNLEGENLIEGQGKVWNKSYFDGNAGASSSYTANNISMTAEELTAKNKSFGLFPEMNFAISGIAYEIVGIENIKGIDVYVLKSNNGLTETFDYYDAKTFLKLKSLTIKDGVQKSEVNYSDYKAVEGFMFPHAKEEKIGFSVKSGNAIAITLNGKVDLNSFKGKITF
jgi:hypothetical protein